MNINQWLKDHPRECRRGAPMGDADWEGDSTYPYKFFLQRLKFTDGDYALDGTYWGAPANVWCAMDDNALIRIFVRASRRYEARAQILDKYPNARFYR